jgi:hypothetical protein
MAFMHIESILARRSEEIPTLSGGRSSSGRVLWKEFVSEQPENRQYKRRNKREILFMIEGI